MKEEVGKILKKYPILFQCLRTLYQKLSFIVRKIKLLSLNKTDRKLNKIFEDFIILSGIKTNEMNFNKIDENKLSTNYLDDEIETLTLEYYKENKNEFLKEINFSSNNRKNIGIVFTEIYAVGGHTPVIERFVDSLKEKHSIVGYATMNSSCKNFKLKEQIKVHEYHWLNIDVNYTYFISNLYNQIISDNINIIYTCLHPHDIVAASTLSLLKKYTNIKIIQFNLADHFYYLGFKFAHLIIDARPSGQRITKEVRGYQNTILMPLQQRKKEDTIYFPEDEKQKLRKKLRIEEDEYFTLTGTANFKIFEKNGSRYFEMIKDLLSSEPKLKHVLMTELLSNDKSILLKIFKNDKHLLNRLIIINRVSNFDIYMQACDLFIDSFPQGGALIHLDMMRNKRPTVLKINKANPVRSFEYYLPKDYEYQYDNIEDMKNGILKLLRSRKEQEKASEKLYEYYLDNYEFEIVKKKYKQLIDNSDNLEQFFGKNFYENRSS